jgi:anti-anti-sigma factor
MTAISNAPSATVVLNGEIDIATAPAIRRFLMAAISGGDVHLAVDMSGVTSIDAAGIDVLVVAANRAREAGRTVAAGTVPAGAAAPGCLGPRCGPAGSPALSWPSRCRQRRLRPVDRS